MRRQVEDDRDSVWELVRALSFMSSLVELACPRIVLDVVMIHEASVRCASKLLG